MSHPCGSYDKNTLKILKKLGIELGFRDLMTIDAEKGKNKVNNSFVEIARENHATIYKKMNKLYTVHLHLFLFHWGYGVKNLMYCEMLFYFFYTFDIFFHLDIVNNL